MVGTKDKDEKNNNLGLKKIKELKNNSHKMDENFNLWLLTVLKTNSLLGRPWLET